MGVFDIIAQSLTRGVTTQLSAVVPLGLQQIFGGTGDPLPSQFNIDEFRTNLSAHGELAKSDKFNVVIIVPNVIQQASGISIRELTLQCEASELPSRDINVIEYRHYGFIKRIPHNNQYGQATFTFMCAGDMWEKRLFDRWMDVMVPTNSGLVSYTLDSQGNSLYEAPIFINQYNANGQVIYTSQLIDAIPTSVAPLGLDWSSDQPHKLTVTFNFRKWISDATTANVSATDFGQAVGGPVTLAPQAVSPINNQTNNGANNSTFGSAIGSGILTNLSGSLNFRI